MSDRISGFSLDTGLENIARLRDQELNLPAQSEAKLTGGQVRQRLNELFAGPSLDLSLRRFVSPEPSNPAILIPAQFEALVQEGYQNLQEQNAKSNNPILQRANELLAKEQELRQLFSYYRNTLKEA